MICETCHGNGEAPAKIRGPRNEGFGHPCPDCAGSGFMSCCEGMCGMERDGALNSPEVHYANS